MGRYRSAVVILAILGTIIATVAAVATSHDEEPLEYDMSDYPDYFELIQIVGADIMVPIDVQGAYIMMPVDIQAQYLTLEIDLVAQSVGAVQVDITAMTVGEINVDINAQSVGDIAISIDAQTIGMASKPFWEQEQGAGKAFSGLATNQLPDATLTSNYTPAAGKTLYVISFGCWCSATTDADKDKHQMVQFDVAGYRVGGDGGFSVNLDQPVRILAETMLTWTLYNMTNHNVDMGYWIRGFELG